MIDKRESTNMIDAYFLGGFVFHSAVQEWSASEIKQNSLSAPMDLFFDSILFPAFSTPAFFHSPYPSTSSYSFLFSTQNRLFREAYLSSSDFSLWFSRLRFCLETDFTFLCANILLPPSRHQTFCLLLLSSFLKRMFAFSSSCSTIGARPFCSSPNTGCEQVKCV